jgi:hypothetical protein
MANHRAIAAVSTALQGLIRDAYPRDEFGTGLNVALYQTRDFETPMQEGISVYLYRVAPNGTVRNRSVRRTPAGEAYRPSLILDLHYLVTPWAQDGERQHRLLGWVMRLMEEMGVLGAGLLNHYLGDADTFEPHDGLEVVLESLAFGDYLTLWDRLRPRLPASATYVVRGVPIDSVLRVGEGAPVLTRRFDMAVIGAG